MSFTEFILISVGILGSIIGGVTGLMIVVILRKMFESIAELREKKRKKNSFWKSQSLEELAKSQNVKPIKDVRTILGTWPDKDEEDGQGS